MADISASSTRPCVVKMTAALFAVLLLVGACAKKDEPSATSTGTTAPGSSSNGGGSSDSTDPASGGLGGAVSEATGVETIKVPTAEVWYSGFKVTFGDGRLDKAAQTLSFEATIENLGEDNYTFYESAALEADGTVEYTGSWKDQKDVVKKAKAKDTLTFTNIERGFDVKTSTLVIGRDGRRAVRIPLGSTGELVTLAPVKQDYVGTITLGQMTVEVKQTEIRYDFPQDHAAADADKAYLILTGTQKNNSSEDTLYWTNRDVVLTKPDGTKAQVDTFIGNSSPNATEKDDGFGLLFELGDPWPGDYTLDLNQPFGPEGDDVQTSIKLTLKEAGKK